MEIFFCLQCFLKFEKPRPQPVKCPSCGHDYIYWHTSPYKSEQNLPKEILNQINNE